jgi:hypothetical protein
MKDQPCPKNRYMVLDRLDELICSKQATHSDMRLHNTTGQEDSVGARPAHEEAKPDIKRSFAEEKKHITFQSAPQKPRRSKLAGWHSEARSVMGGAIGSSRGVHCNRAGSRGRGQTAAQTLSAPGLARREIQIENFLNKHTSCIIRAVFDRLS